MLNDEKKHMKRKTLVIVLLFLVILTGSRLAWMAVFYKTDQPQIVNGKLDLRNWDAVEGHTINLDGEWEFYPHTFLIGKQVESHEVASQLIQVPGKWDDSLQLEGSTPYGYGSYRLKILVNPKHDYIYSIRVPSVRSSSELYVNGRLLTKSGQPAANEKDYIASNIPYTASFTTNGKNVIEVIVQAANFKDPRESGLVRSMKFGTEGAIVRETLLSSSMQQMVAAVFLMHAVYAFILYWIGTREKSLLYLSFLIISAMFMNLLGSEEKILFFWFPINYDLGFKLIHLAMVGIAYSLFLLMVQPSSPFFRKFHPVYVILCAIAAILSLILPVRNVVMIQPLYFTLILISFVLSIVILLRKAIAKIKDSILLLLACFALMSSFLWWGVFLITGIKLVYYPFDMIISTACFASVWFKDYFEVHYEAKKLAVKLQKADKLKDDFLANTSHELRNPLHGILNISQAVLEREQFSLSRKSIKDLESVLSVGRRMSLMLNDLLDVMSLKQSVPRLQLRNFSMQTIITGVFDMLHFMTDGKMVQLVNRIPENFPQVYADENRVIQIVYNLLHNAVKYTNEGEVSIRGFVKDGKAYIVISDSGIGMDAETVKRVFAPYEQGDLGKAMIEGGFGLGLSISKQLIELHGGILQVSSVPDQGSEFIFTLQLFDSNASHEEIETKSFTSSNLIKSTLNTSYVQVTSSIEQHAQLLEGRPRILVVDDDPVNLQVIESVLSLEQYDIMTVTSGKKALALLNTKEWDLVISDVMMPQMSGYELSREIRNRFEIMELPILLLTARSQPEDIENGFLAGANDYVIKPVDALELRSRVRALTVAKQSVRERLQMEAAWLQAQIQPHFLFNTLNAVVALSEINLDKMRELIYVLCDFLRNKFEFQNMNELSPLEAELSIVRSYLYIEQVRFGAKLEVEWEIDECEELKIPLLTIQPLVENAIKHGIMKRNRGGRILIRVSNYETYTEISVEDDGVGMNEATLERILERKSDIRSGVGLINTNLRLKRHFGKGLRIESRSGFGTKISFIVHQN